MLFTFSFDCDNSLSARLAHNFAPYYFSLGIESLQLQVGANNTSSPRIAISQFLLLMRHLTSLVKYIC